MFIIRRAKIDDAGTLYKLARMVHFINLPPDREIITQKIVHSRNSFLSVINPKAPPEPEPPLTTLRADAESVIAAKVPGDAVSGGFAGGGAPQDASQPSTNKLAGLGQSSAESDVYVFVMEDTESRGVLGTSQIVSKMGGPGNPNVSFKLEERRFFSESIQTGTSHTVARLYMDESGPSEIGGLILQPSYRGHKLKLGKFLSLVRFHFVGLWPRRFSERILAEMMAPLSGDGESLLWDALGRRFVPLSYDEANRFCQYSREFIASLLPRDDIYLSLLPPPARAVVGQVGPETVPARKMLENLGFAYEGFVDPFDGGPHLRATTADIELVRQTERRPLGIKTGRGAKSLTERSGIISQMDSRGDFAAVNDRFWVDAEGRVLLTDELAEAINAHDGETIGVTPLDRAGPLPGKPLKARAGAGSRSKAGSKPSKRSPKSASGKKSMSKGGKKRAAGK